MFLCPAQQSLPWMQKRLFANVLEIENCGGECQKIQCYLQVSILYSCRGRLVAQWTYFVKCVK